MLIQYIKFSISGGLLGLIAWALQLFIFKIINSHVSYAYAVASCLTYMPLVILNFWIQRTLVFNRPGLFWRFLIANMGIMILVTFLSTYCQQIIALIWDEQWGTRCGFMVAALFGSIPSFLIKRYWVFREQDLSHCYKY